jgi:hypothetical protein
MNALFRRKTLVYMRRFDIFRHLTGIATEESNLKKDDFSSQKRTKIKVVASKQSQKHIDP